MIELGFDLSGSSSRFDLLAPTKRRKCSGEYNQQVKSYPTG